MVVTISLSFAWRQRDHPASVPSNPLPIAARPRGKSPNKLSHITAKKKKPIKNPRTRICTAVVAIVRMEIERNERERNLRAGGYI
jgi:hypothetical protein